jgi:type II secretory pathway pseudopilin PulG
MVPKLRRIMGLVAGVALLRLVQMQQEARVETAEMELLQQFLTAALLMLAVAAALHNLAELKEQAVAVAGVEHKQQPMELLEL